MQLHASSVAFDKRAVLIRGASGSGKSALALQLIALGARLVADDRTNVTLRDGAVFVSTPPQISGLIEARGIGLLEADVEPTARLCLVVDMDQAETQRLPMDRSTEISGCSLPLLHKVESAHFAAAVRQYLLWGKATR